MRPGARKQERVLSQELEDILLVYDLFLPEEIALELKADKRKQREKD
jgi:hypothetical protein